MDQNQTNHAKVMSFGDWMITILISVIPIVNIVMFIVWAVSSTDNPNRVNWARATLAWFAIMVGIYILIGILVLGLFAF